MRQDHPAGDKLFVDYSGKKIGNQAIKGVLDRMNDYVMRRLGVRRRSSS